MVVNAELHYSLYLSVCLNIFITECFKRMILDSMRVPERILQKVYPKNYPIKNSTTV